MKLVPDFCLRVLDRVSRELDAYRVARTKRLFKACGAGVFLSPRAIIWPESGLEVGDDVSIHSFTHIFAGGGVTIGKGAMISSGCSIASVTHPIEVPDRRTAPLIMKPVHIGEHVWIGTAAVILPGVTIGHHAVIGAGSVVTKDVPPESVWAGNPARLLRIVQGLR